MELHFQPASAEHLDEIMQIVHGAVIKMEQEQIFQWDAVYPAREHFQEDLKKKQLFAGTAAGRIAVVYALNQECDAQYQNAVWQYHGSDFAVIHRLCVSPAFQHRGIAKATLLHIEQTLRNMGAKAIRLDVFSENPYALRLYRNSGFYETGTAHWRKGTFILMEKQLQQQSSGIESSGSA